MPVRMIALDLDGTALLPDRVTVSAPMRRAVEEAADRGILVVPVTGRPYRLLPPFLLEHPGWESYAILCNGAEIRNLRTGEILAHHAIEGKMLQKVLEISEKYGIPAEFNADGQLYLTGRSLRRELLEPRLLYHCTVYIPKHGTLVEELGSLCGMTVEKVHLNCIPEDRWGEILQELKALPLSVVCEKMPNLEVTHALATKGRGLQMLCRELDIPLHQVLAIGDSGNDLSMLRTAGIGVAMGSAPEFLKKEAQFLTGTNLEDGAAAAIRRFAL